MKKFLLFILSFALHGLVIKAQIYQEWVANYSTIDTISERQGSMTVDDSGNVYVVATVENLGTGLDYATIKYDKSGIQQWIAFYNNLQFSGKDIATAIVTDNAGDIIVTGMSEKNSMNFDVATIKYNSSGNLQWIKQYSGTDDGNDKAYAINIDNNDNILVSGHSYDTSSNYDYLTIKYNSSGNEEWVKTYNGTGNDIDEAVDILTDGSGNIYVTGSSKGNNADFDYATLKYDASGNLLWEARYNNSINGEDKATAIGINNTGDILVTGMSDGNGASKDFLTVKYNSNGVQQWETRYDGPVNSEDVATSLAVAQNGKVYVAGKSTGNNGDFDYATIAYTPSGQMQWLQRYDGAGSSNDFVSDLKIDGSNNVYITGASIGNNSMFDYTTIKYKQNGQLEWTKRFSSIENSIPNKIALDANENVYVRGVSKDVLEKLTTIKYSKIPPGCSCADAMPVLPENPCIPKDINIGCSSTWMKLSSDSSNIKITADSPILNSDTLMSHVEKMILWEGTCGNLNKRKEETYAHDNSPNIFEANNLITGNTYFLEIKRYNVQNCPVCQKDETFRNICIENPNPTDVGTFSTAFSFIDVCGLDYCITSRTLNQRLPGNGMIGAAQPATLQVTCLPLPANTTIVAAYIYFVTIGMTDNVIPFSLSNPSGTSFNFNGVITANGQGRNTNTATCWGADYGNRTTAFRADVTSAIKGNGQYKINGLPTNVTAPFGQKKDVDGVSLIIIYQSCKINQKASLVIWDGLQVVRGGETSFSAKISGINPYPSISSQSAFFLIGDIESQTISYSINGSPVSFAPAIFWQHVIATPTISPVMPFNITSTQSDCFVVPTFGVYQRNNDPSGLCIPPGGPIADAGPDKIICPPPTGGPGTTVIGTPAIGGYSYIWSPSAGLNNSNIAQPTVTLIGQNCSPIIYSLTVTDQNGCKGGDQVAVTFLNLAPTITSISVSAPDLCTGARTLTTNYSGCTNGLSFLWSTGATSQTITVPNPFYLNTQTYSVTATTPCGTAQKSITIPYFPVLSGTFPTVIAPNAMTSTNPLIVYQAGQASGYTPAYNATDYNLIVFDRWGTKVYDYTASAPSGGFSNGQIQWNGVPNISHDYPCNWLLNFLNLCKPDITAGVYVPQGVYTWQLRFKNCNHQSWMLKTTKTITVL